MLHCGGWTQPYTYSSPQHTGVDALPIHKKEWGKTKTGLLAVLAGYPDPQHWMLFQALHVFIPPTYWRDALPIRKKE